MATSPPQGPHEAPGHSAARAPAAGELGARLCDLIARERGETPGAVRLHDLRRMAGGASRELWSLDVEIGGERLALVLRRDPPGRVGESDRGLEFRLLRAAAGAGVPVPRVLFCDPTGETTGSPCFLMERVPGETLARRLLRDAQFATARRVMTAQLGATLARIHSLDPADPALAGLPATPADVLPGRADVVSTAERARTLALEPHPVLELAERWLLARVPARNRRTVVHGDFRIGNVIFDGEGLRSVLDWELSHVGDPLEDLAWLCARTWRFGSDALPVGGIGTREELVGAYEAAGGEKVDRSALRFWEVAANFRIAVVWLNQSRAFLDGKVQSVELASLGRRTAESEDELLRLMREKA
jgi:aminoglycoside phosphotransferase (APT) family kinase protein